jgi:hypothetical protein
MAGPSPPENNSLKELRELIEELADDVHVMNGKIDHLIQRDKLHRSSSDSDFPDFDS